MGQYEVAVWSLIGGDRCWEVFYESLALNSAGTFFTDRKSGGGRCAEVTVIRGSTVLLNALAEAIIQSSSQNSLMYYIYIYSYFYIFLLFPGAYGCSFVAKLSWKKKFFLKKYLFFTKYTLFAEKNNFIWKKKIILIFFCLLKKLFLQKMKKIYISFEKYFLSRKYIFIWSWKIYLLKLPGELNNLVLKVSEAPNMWYSLN